MVGVEDDGDPVEGSHGADEVRAGNGAGNGRLLLLSRVGDALAGEEGGTTLRGLDDDGRLGVAGGLERGDPVQRVLEQARSGESRGWFHRGVCDVHGGARGDVDGGHRKALGAGVGEELNGTRKVSLSSAPSPSS